MDDRVRRCRWFAATCGLVSFIMLQSLGAWRAEASCGDWLAHAGDTFADSGSEAARHSQSGGQSSAKQDDRSSRLPLSKTCHGPLCRRAPSQPAPTAPANVLSHGDQLALSGLVQSPSPKCPKFDLGGESEAHAARGFPARIDHPPRA